MFDIVSEKFAFSGKNKFRIDSEPTKVKAFYESKEDYYAKLHAIQQAMVPLQKMFYAHDRYALLLIFQGMDAAGKDSAILHTLSGLNPQGCQVFSFKEPSKEEQDHDFMWRAHKALPERGRIGVFNRSYYEEVLIVKVHPEALAPRNLPAEYAQMDKDFWKNRYEDIRNTEAYWTRQGVRIVKFFLHISKEEQKKRLLERLEEPDKNWKLALSDVTERAHWNKYQEVYQDCINETATKNSPWHVIPADDKRNARLIIAQTVLDELESLDLHYPILSEKQQKELADIRRALENEKD